MSTYTQGATRRAIDNGTLIPEANIVISPDLDETRTWIEFGRQYDLSYIYPQHGTEAEMDMVKSASLVILGRAGWLDGKEETMWFSRACTFCLSGDPTNHARRPTCRSGGERHCTCDTCF